jgi:hypothetical protein
VTDKSVDIQSCAYDRYTVVCPNRKDVRARDRYVGRYTVVCWYKGDRGGVPATGERYVSSAALTGYMWS